MKAEDTVLTVEEIKARWEGWPHDKPSPPTFNQWLCLAQAEATWEAKDAEMAELTKKGEELCCSYGNALLKIHDLEKEIEAGRAEGRKEVMEWVDKESLDRKGNFGLYLNKELWQEFKRSKGIE